MSFAANNNYPLIVALSVTSAACIYAPAALASGPMPAGITFAVAYSLTAAAFQIDYWQDLLQRQVTCRQKTLWALQLPFSTIANLTSFFLACDGIDRWGDGASIWLKLMLKIFAGLGCSVEAFFGVLATDYVRNELIYSWSLLMGLFCEKYKHAAYRLNAGELVGELEYFGRVPGLMAPEDSVKGYEAAERALPYSPLYRHSAILLSLLVGTGSAVCFALTVVPFMLGWVTAAFPVLSEQAHKPYLDAVIALLITTNFYNLIFCSVFGNMGARAFFNKILPSLVDRERCLPAFLTLAMIGVSTWLLVELALTGDHPIVNIGAAFNTVYAAPGALGVATKVFALCKRPQMATVVHDTLSGDEGERRPLVTKGGSGSINYQATGADQSSLHK